MKHLVTSALPYVNNIPHLGNLIPIVSADVYSRYLKSKAEQVIFVCGTDEHGTTTESKAIEEGLTPKEICDKYFAIHKKIYEWFNTDIDCLGRTSSLDNAEVTQDIFKKLNENDFIIQKKTKQFFDEQKETFLADRFIKGTCPHCAFTDAKGDQCDNCGKLLEPEELQNPISTLSNTHPILKETEHLYIDLPKIEPELTKWIESKEKNWSENAKTITHAWLKEKLEPRCITRDLKWGIPVPIESLKPKVFYSWFDAPIGYISITKENRKDWKDWWQNKDVKLTQFMGKDNTQFHTILFPSFLLGSRDPYVLVDTLSVNEYLNYADGKFSKSRGTGVFGDKAMQTGIPADAFRYYMTAIRPEREDTTFDWIDFGQKMNRELVDNYANLVNRTIAFTNRFFEGEVGEITKDHIIDFTHVERNYEKIELKQALKNTMQIAKSLNQYFQENEPWKLIKEDTRRAANVLAVLVNRVKDLTILLQPVIPFTATQVFKQLNIDEKNWNDLGKNSIPKGHKLGEAKPLFKKLEEKEIQQFKEEFKGNQQSKEFILDLKVGKITDVRIHEDASKLYVIKVDLGSETRQIVSGLKDYYEIEELVDKNVIIVTNLEEATIRGVKSQGMLLAGVTKEKECKVLESKFSRPGEQVFIENYTISDKTISIDEFAKVKMTILDKGIYFNKQQLKTVKENISVNLSKGKVC